MTLVVVEDEVDCLGHALGRPIWIATHSGIIQTCLVCNTDLVVPYSDIREDRDALRRRLFLIYDDHRCGRELSMSFACDDGLDELFARTEAAALTMAARAGASELDDDLRARIERESDLLAIWAARLAVYRSHPIDAAPRPSKLSAPIIEDELVSIARHS